MISKIFSLVFSIYTIVCFYIQIQPEIATVVAPHFSEAYYEAFTRITDTILCDSGAEHANPRKVASLWREFHTREAELNWCKEGLNAKGVKGAFYKVYSQEYLHIIKTLTETMAKLNAKTNCCLLYQGILQEMPDFNWVSPNAKEQECVLKHWQKYHWEHNPKDIATVNIYKCLREPFEADPGTTGYPFPKYVREYVDVTSIINSRKR
jgi:hypothetical protein